MENYIVYDFFGMPGSGKSTISHAYSKQLIKESKKVSEPSYLVDHNYTKIKRVVIKCLRTFGWFMHHPVRFIRLVRLISSFGNNGMLSDIINVAYKAYALEQQHRNITIFDEGLTQAAISMAVGSNQDCEFILERLLNCIQCDKKIVRVYVKDSIENCLIKLELRNTKDSRVDRENNPDKKLLMLKKFEKCCDSIKADIVLDLCRNSDLNQLISQIDCF